MNDSTDDDLPDIAIDSISHVTVRQITKIDVDAEIAGNLARKELKKKISEQKIEFKEELPKLIEIQDAPEPKICSFPPQRQVFDPKLSLKVFKSDTIGIESFSSSNFNSCTSTNADEFFMWMKAKYKNSSEEIKREFLRYLWLLISCHPDPSVVLKCYDVLVEFNSCWKLQYEEVILVLKNWGVPLRDFVSNLDFSHILAPLDADQLVSVCNVQHTLQILRCQLMVEDLGGDQSLRRTLFIILTLLPLDKNYFACLPDVCACLEELIVFSKSGDPLWVESYCEGLFQVELHHAQVAFLAECVVPQSMRWCICFAYCQQVFSLDQTFFAEPEPSLLQDILLDNVDKLLKLGSWELYSLISLVDTGISLAVTCETEYSVRKGFMDWLSCYMERRIERRTDDIDVDASYIAELVSRLQAEWESTWLAEPGAQNMSVDEVEFGEELNESSEQDS
ncbi:hypothetical protein ONE63_009436 [Megalurothrips usitatus]|uniref:Coiled-coil SMC6 And NSE5 INteracting (CANIN) domain-containing protein n=1 Tax=Megalurothrips usitatus TaxID=439358 RepID=A0AAV7XPC3_9NEOP|nr:hypothetical protein ONE63_009436 [Megalurothrips usitatus]